MAAITEINKMAAIAWLLMINTCNKTKHNYTWFSVEFEHVASCLGCEPLTEVTKNDCHGFTIKDGDF